MSLISEVFTIPRQKFRHKVRIPDDWIVKLKVVDQLGEEKQRDWDVETSFKTQGRRWFLEFSGRDTDYLYKYEKYNCKIKIYSQAGTKLLTAIQQQTRGFRFSSVFDLGCEGRNFKDGIDISFTIGWSDQKKSFIRQKMMLDEDVLTDMLIKTKQQKFPCHKFVLVAESKYFGTMFETDMMEKNTNIVDWTDVFEAPVVNDLLHFFYTGEKPPKLKDNHFKLIEAAHLCLLPELKSICARSIAKIIRVDNALRVLQTAELYQSEELKTIAFKFVVANSEKVLTNEVLHMDIKIVTKSFSSSLLVIP